MAQDKQYKDFSEPTGPSLNDKCKLCQEPLPREAYHFSNQAAIKHGYCCWMCCLSHLGMKKAYRILEDRAKQNQASRGKQ